MLTADRLDVYGEAALNRVLAELRGAGLHERNHALNRAAYSLGRLVGGQVLDEGRVRDELLSVAAELGLSPVEAHATINSGLRAGEQNPRAPEDRHRSPDRPPLVRPEPTEQGPAPRPPRTEVERLWTACAPVTEDREVSTWLAGRAIPPERVELYDLARALPPGARVPRWASCRRVPWSAHHRLICRGWGAAGTVESLHARCIGEPPEGMSKGLWPAAGPGSARGLVLADGWGRHLLARGERPEGWCGELVICEGLPDWLTVATAHSDADADAPAVLGVTSGSWIAELAARVPDGTRVIIATDPDGAGDGYAERIVRTLQGRCEWRRWRGPWT